MSERENKLRKETVFFSWHLILTGGLPLILILDIEDSFTHLEQ